MSTIRYELSTKIDKNGESEIYLNIQSTRDKHYRLKTGVKVAPEEYVRLIKADKITSLSYLGELEKKLYDALPCPKEEAQRVLDMVANADDILSSYDRFCEEHMIEKGLSKGTMELYHSVRVVLDEYMGRPMSIKSISTIWLNGVIMKMSDDGLSNVTQSNYWSVIKVYLRWLVKNKVLDHDILEYKPIFKEAENDVIYLTHNELYRVVGLDLKGARKRARDIFVVQAMTGMRYSDMINIKKENIREDVNGKYISIVTKKTTQRIKIYLNSNVCDILEEYDYDLPHPDKETINYHLPKICKMAKIDSDIDIVKFYGTERKVEHKKKYELITTHTARRTFICLCIEKGISTTIIRSITGHRQLSSFQRYVGVGDKSKADVVAKLEI